LESCDKDNDCDRLDKIVGAQILLYLQV